MLPAGEIVKYQDYRKKSLPTVEDSVPISALLKKLRYEKYIQTINDYG
jgi:hypothetical protein